MELRLEDLQRSMSEVAFLTSSEFVVVESVAVGHFTILKDGDYFHQGNAANIDAFLWGMKLALEL